MHTIISPYTEIYKQYETVIWDEDDQLVFESESSYDPAKDENVIDFSMLYDDSEESYETSSSSAPRPPLPPHEDDMYQPMVPTNESVELGIHLSDDSMISSQILPYNAPTQSSLFSGETIPESEVEADIKTQDEADENKTSCESENVSKLKDKPVVDAEIEIDAKKDAPTTTDDDALGQNEMEQTVKDDVFETNMNQSEETEANDAEITKSDEQSEQTLADKIEAELEEQTKKILQKIEETKTNNDNNESKSEQNAVKKVQLVLDEEETKNDSNVIDVSQFKRTPKAKKAANSRKGTRKMSAAQKEKQIRKKSRAIKGTIVPPKLSEQMIVHEDGTQEFIQIKMVHLFARCRCHHKLRNYKNMNYASKSYQLDPKLVVSALDKEKSDRGQCLIGDADYVFVKKNVGTQKEYKMALRTNGNDVNDAVLVLGFVETKLDESLEKVKKITKFNHDVCFQSIIAEMNSVNNHKK